MEIVSLVIDTLKRISDAKNANDAQAEAEALADLDAALAEHHPAVLELKDKIAANRAAARADLDRKFPDAAAKDEETKP